MLICLAASTKEYGILRDRKITLAADGKRIGAEYAAVCAEAIDKFGTSDVGKLLEMLAEGRQKNTDIIDDFQANLAAIKISLQTIEAEHSNLPVTNNRL